MLEEMYGRKQDSRLRYAWLHQELSPEPPKHREWTRRLEEDVPIAQVPTNDTPGTKTFVDVHISKPPDPNANEVAPRRSARLDQETQ